MKKFRKIGNSKNIKNRITLIKIIVLFILIDLLITSIIKYNLTEKDKLSMKNFQNSINLENSILQNEIIGIEKSSRQEANKENISDGKMIESTLIDRQVSAYGKTFTYQKGNYKTFLVATFYFTYSGTANLINNAKISCENINYNEITYSCWPEKIESAGSVNRLYLLQPTNENFSITFQITDTFCIYGFNEELSITPIKGSGNFRGLNSIETNNYDYLLVGTTYFDSSRNKVNLSSHAYIYVDKHQVEKIMESAYEVVDDQTSCYGVQRVFLIKTNKANSNANILTANGTDSCYICGVNIK